MTAEDNDFFIEIESVRSILIRSKPSHQSSCGRDEWLIRRYVFGLKTNRRKFGVGRNGGFPVVDACQSLNIEDRELLNILRNAFRAMDDVNS